MNMKITEEILHNKYDNMFEVGFPSWIDCDSGWYQLIDTALSLIQFDIKHNKMPLVKVTQIKEKFGRLEIYFNGGDEKTCGIIDMATSISYHTCEVCGSTKDIGQTKGWIKTVCEDCVKEHNILHWEKYK